MPRTCVHICPSSNFSCQQLHGSDHKQLQWAKDVCCVSSQKLCTESRIHSCQSQVSLVFQADQPEPVEKTVQRHTPRKKAEEKVLYDFLSSIAFECSCSAILVISPSASLHATTLYLHALSYHLCNLDDKGSHKLTLNQQETLVSAGTNRCCMAVAY